MLIYCQTPITCNYASNDREGNSVAMPLNQGQLINNGSVLNK